MGYRNKLADSDSVNLGSNPSSPATANADVSGISRPPSASEKSEQSEQTAHTGRTESGTARYRVIERNGWSYVVPALMVPMPHHSGPWRYRWEAQDYADDLNAGKTV